MVYLAFVTLGVRESVPWPKESWIGSVSPEVDTDAGVDAMLDADEGRGMGTDRSN